MLLDFWIFDAIEYAVSRSLIYFLVNVRINNDLKDQKKSVRLDNKYPEIE